MIGYATLGGQWTYTVYSCKYTSQAERAAGNCHVFHRIHVTVGDQPKTKNMHYEINNFHVKLPQ